MTSNIKAIQDFRIMTNNNITLTKTENDDLNAFFQFQLDKEAII